MEKKRSVIFLVAIFLFLCTLNYVAAASCSLTNDNQLMFRLTSAENAHGEMWNGTNNYPVEVCFNTIFGFEYQGSSTHECSVGSSNKIIGLSSNSNAHAESPEQTNYNFNVCFGDLTCRSTSSCDTDEQLVVTLSGSNNAHLGTTGYSTNICCKIAAKNAYWSDLNSSRITSTDLDDTVALVLNNSGNSQIRYEIWRVDSFLGINPLNPDEKILDNTTTGSLHWKANVSGNYYFKVFLGENEFESENLEVRPTRHNSPPFVKITKPNNGELYFVNSPVEFKQISYDIDDEITSIWNLGNGQTNLSYNFNYTYTTIGQKQITLTITDSRGLYAIDRVDIYLLNDIPGVVVAPYVEYPSEGEAIVNSLLKIQYFGSNTSVINLTSGSGQNCITGAICLAGNCPSIISNSPICNLSGGNIQITGTRGINYEFLLYNWTFFNLDNQNSKVNIVGTGDVARYGEKVYSSRGFKTINLTVSYPAAAIGYSGTSSRHFTLMSGSYCSENRDYFYIVDNENNTISQKPTATTDGCMGPDNIVGGIDCCPAGNICVVNSTSGEYGCRPATNGTSFKCEDYTDKTSCENDLFNGVQGSPAYGIVGCGNTKVELCTEYSKSCACVFNNNACNFTEIITSQNSICGVIGPAVNIGNCTINTLESQCLNGYKTVELRKTAYGDIPAGTCENEIVTIPCGRNVAALPFFEAKQIVIAILIIFVIYIAYFMINKKDKKKINKRKK